MHRDENGFECVLHGGRYEAVERMALQALGQGDVCWPVDGPRSCLFKATDVGVAIIMGEVDGSVKINCVRGVAWNGLLPAGTGSNVLTNDDAPKNGN
jgi:hypothetical protein